MPEFVMEGLHHAARAESDFTRGFIEAAFFTNQSCYDSEDWETPEAQRRIREGQADGDLPNDVGYCDIEPGALVTIRAFCEAFETQHAALLESAYAAGYDEDQAGRDYWFTLGGHGVGYWSREELGDIGAKLDEVTGRREIHPMWDKPHVTFWGL